MSTQYGVTSVGFVVKQQQVIISEINAILQTTFGGNINLGPESVFGQLVGVFSEREALIWQLGEAIYNSQYPTGAEGTSVDNILALNNLKRLPAKATVTNNTPDLQFNGITLYGLVLKGTAGTTVPVNSIIQTTASPPLSFTLDSAVLINAAVNAIQTIFLSNIPNTGALSLSIADTAGNTLTSPSILFNSLGNQSQFNIASLPSTGSFKLTLTQAGVVLSTATISGASGYPAASVVQSAITALSGYSGVTVTNPTTGNYIISWGSICNPLLTITSNTTGVTITPTDSWQSAINNLHDTAAGNYPYTDVQCSATSQSFAFTFGSGTPIGANPVSKALPQALMLIVSNTLQLNTTVTNINIVNTAPGSPAQGTGSATCTATGPNFVAAGTLTVIGSPLSGWTSVTNQLDCVLGTNVETDTQALIRRSALLSEQANGPLASIVEKVSQLSGVTACVGFQNITNAAQQLIAFASAPASGSYTLTVNGLTTGSISATASAATVQNAIQALAGYSTALVTGSSQTAPYQFTVDFNGSNGGQGQPLISFATNTTGVTSTVAFGRPPHSFEIIVEGGVSADIAKTIFETAPAGIGSYGASILNTTGTLNSSSSTITSMGSTSGIAVGNAVVGQGIIPGTTVTSVNAGASTITLSTIPTITASGVSLAFNNTFEFTDQFGNPFYISFSRPTEIAIYVVINLTTDIYNTPGNSGSGVNPNSKFNVQTINTIQNDIVTIGDAVSIGGLIIGFGTNGLIGAFNSVPGIVSYTMNFGTTPSPSTNTNVQMGVEQVPLFETFNIVVSYS